MAVEISTDAGRLDIGLIHAFLSERSHWAQGIARESVVRALAHSLCFGAYDRDAQIGLARVVTDFSTFAWLADVFVVEAHRGRGIGAQLMEAVVGHPDLRALKRLALVTSTAPALYARYGFTALVRPDIWMERLAAVQLPPA